MSHAVQDPGRGRPVRRTLEDTTRDPLLAGRSIHVPRPRQLRDEVTSGGSQPTDISVIHRRDKPPAFRALHSEGGQHEIDHPTV